MCNEDCPVRLEKRYTSDMQEYWVLLDDWDQCLWHNGDPDCVDELGIAR